MEPEPFVPQDVASHATWFRLNDQLAWYDRKSGWNQRSFKRLRLAQLVLSAAIPFFSLGGTGSFWGRMLPGLLGGLVATLEGIQQLFQFNDRWFEYRATAEILIQEKFLFLAGSGPYRELSPSAALQLLAERVEEAVSQEHARWQQTKASEKKETEKGKDEERDEDGEG